MQQSAPRVSVLIATYNRAAFLDRTLESIAALRVAPGRTWEVIVVDNNSRDRTREIVERHARGFPVRLRYLLETVQGRRPAIAPEQLVDTLAHVWVTSIYGKTPN